MKFYPDKFRVLRKKSKLTAEEVAAKMGVNRRTVSTWETGKVLPNESRIRMLAKVICVPVDVVSDLKEGQPISQIQFSEIVNSWLEVAEVSSSDKNSKFDILMSGISSIKKSYNEASLIINAMLNSISSIFYLKDAKLKYITANKEFFKNLSLRNEFSVINKTDKDFFIQTEAQQNSEEDAEVVRSGKKVINREGFIPGSRKKKWGLISKIPVYDDLGNIQGIIGSFVDITERKKTEEIRELLEANLNIVEEAITVIAKCRSNTRQVIYANKVNEKIYGMTLEDIKSDIGYEKWLGCVHPDYLQNEIKYYRNFSWPAKRIFKIVIGANSEKWIEAFCNRFERKNKHYYFFAERDITESIDRKNFIDKLEEAVNQSEEVIWCGCFADKSEKFLKLNYLSKSTEKMFDVQISDLKETPFKWFEMIIKEDRNKVENWFRKEEAGEILCRLKSQAVKVKWVQMKRVIKDNSFFIFINDITKSIETCLQE
jgi:PAS domain S-box-containing protein